MTRETVDVDGVTPEAAGDGNVTRDLGFTAVTVVEVTS